MSITVIAKLCGEVGTIDPSTCKTHQFVVVITPTTRRKESGGTSLHHWRTSTLQTEDIVHIFGRRRVAVARYRMICLVLVVIQVPRFK